MTITNIQSLPFGLIFLLGCIVFLAIRQFAARHIARQIRDWPTTVGKIEICELNHLPDTGTIDLSQLTLQYTYHVDGKPYNNSRIAPGLDQERTRTEELREIHQKLLSSTHVMVRYDPDNPTSSCLSLGMGAQAYRDRTNVILLIMILASMLIAPFNTLACIIMLLGTFICLFVIPITLDLLDVGTPARPDLLTTIAMCDENGKLI